MERAATRGRTHFDTDDVAGNGLLDRRALLGAASRSPAR